MGWDGLGVRKAEGTRSLIGIEEESVNGQGNCEDGTSSTYIARRGIDEVAGWTDESEMKRRGSIELTGRRVV